jgi:hypothetical protein
MNDSIQWRFWLGEGNDLAQKKAGKSVVACQDMNTKIALEMDGKTLFAKSSIRFETIIAGGGCKVFR